MCGFDCGKKIASKPPYTCPCKYLDLSLYVSKSLLGHVDDTARTLSFTLPLRIINYFKQKLSLKCKYS